MAVGIAFGVPISPQLCDSLAHSMAVCGLHCDDARDVKGVTDSTVPNVAAANVDAGTSTCPPYMVLSPNEIL